LADQVIIIYAGTHGYASEVSVEKVDDYEQRLLDFVREKHGAIVDDIATEKELTPETEEALQGALAAFNATLRAA
jgi:F-type H+-transporting ATPase subunit alpha